MSDSNAHEARAHSSSRPTDARLQQAAAARDARRAAADTASAIEAASMSNLIGPSSLIVPTPRDLADRDRRAHAERMARLAAGNR